MSVAAMTVMVWKGFSGNPNYTKTVGKYFSNYPEAVEELCEVTEILEEIRLKVEEGENYPPEMIYNLAYDLGSWMCTRFEATLRVPNEYDKEKFIFNQLCVRMSKDVALSLSDLFNYFDPSEGQEE